MTEKRKQPKAYAIALSKVWGNRFPVDVRAIALEVSATQADPIAKIESLSVYEEEFEGVLAQSPKSKKWGLGYSAHIRETGKINFTIAHEFGHYMLHRAEHNEFACSDDDLRNFPESTEKATPDIEQEANEFASYLLMPINDYRTQVNGNRVTIDLVSHCAERYATSLTASALKLVAFIDRPVAVIVSKKGVVKWSRSSLKALQRGLWFKQGTALPDGSVSMRCAQKGVDGNCTSGQAFNGTVWPGDSAVTESAIAQPNYGTVFTILESSGSGRGAADEDDLDDIHDSFDRFRSFSQ